MCFSVFDESIGEGALDLEAAATWADPPIHSEQKKQAEIVQKNPLKDSFDKRDQQQRDKTQHPEDDQTRGRDHGVTRLGLGFLDVKLFESDVGSALLNEDTSES